MWTVLVVLFLMTSFDVNSAVSLNAEFSDPTVSRLRTVGDILDRFPRKFRENSRTRRLHIENQHGFDGKVEKIHVNSEEDLPGVRAYGMQKKNLENNGYIERKTQEEIIKDIEDTSRIARTVEAYGKAKEQLDMNGYIEVANSEKPPASYQTPSNQRARITRSINAERKQDNLENDAEDLEAQDAKIFRPLFVYRQQVARRQHRGRNYVHRYPVGRKFYYN